MSSKAKKNTQAGTEKPETVDTFVCEKHSALDLGETIQGQHIKFVGGVFRSKSEQANKYIMATPAYHRGEIKLIRSTGG